ncbi:MAG: succinate dehydrogenase/fumarate reductase iron-sulfur subunit [SAR202 cluster bacterium]|jgi:succinate dehydrogenase/fumarate reductase iron-sulfur protein|nr:succinate dehydrogenase/fumarate reductase iron-sulfur subunit [SAR202 cluster bacterium]
METISLIVKRTGQPTGDQEERWNRFIVPYAGESMNVLDSLIWAQRNEDPSLAFRCACRVGMCGSCGVVINGKESLACRTMVRDLRGDSDEIRVEPMRHLPVVRDLVTDTSDFHAKVNRAAPSTELGGAQFAAASVSPLSRERRAIEPQRECIYCGLCYSACSIVGLDDEYLGPAALNRAFVMLADSRNQQSQDALASVANEHGLWRCHTLFECEAVCPKGISPTLAIQRLKRKVITNKLKRLLKIIHPG